MEYHISLSSFSICNATGGFSMQPVHFSFALLLGVDPLLDFLSSETPVSTDTKRRNITFLCQLIETGKRYFQVPAYLLRSQDLVVHDASLNHGYHSYSSYSKLITVCCQCLIRFERARCWLAINRSWGVVILKLIDEEGTIFTFTFFSISMASS